MTAVGPLALTRNFFNGLLTGTTLGSVTDSLTYSTFAEVSSYVARLSGSPIYSESYVRDNLGRITQRTEVLQGVTTVWGYGYDVAGRLVSVTRNGEPYESYTFDSNDNRLTKTTVAGTTTYAHDDQDRLLSAVGPDGAESWVYDGHGDLLSHNGSAGQTSFDYETGGQLMSLTRPDGDVVSYDLDAGNKRAVKRVNGVVQRQWLYAGGLLPVAELDGSGNLVAVFNGGFMVKNGTTYRLLRDHLGSVRMVVDTSTGTVVQSLSYGPWGEVLEDTNPGFQPFGFASGLYEPDIGLVRFGARDYDPGNGRWTCKDPIRLEDGPNVYAYCGSEPLGRADPSGLFDVEDYLRHMGPPDGSSRLGIPGERIGWYLNGGSWEYYSGDEGQAIGGYFGWAGALDSQLRFADEVLSTGDPGNLDPDDLNRNCQPKRRDRKHKYEGKTVEEILREKKGSITNAPLPEGFGLGWNDIRKMTWKEVSSQKGPGWSTVQKLLTDKRFDRSGR